MVGNGMPVQNEFFPYFDPLRPWDNLNGNLPHWRQPGVTYFVTFRLADSIPQEKLALWEFELHRWIETHPEPWSPADQNLFGELFPQRLHEWLDQGYGSCVLAKAEIKQLMESVLRFRDDHHYQLDEFVVMPNHVHVILMPIDKHELSGILHSWKSYSANQINRLAGRDGRLWQKESYDHILRGEWELARLRQYIRDNPKKK